MNRGSTRLHEETPTHACKELKLQLNRSYDGNSFLFSVKQPFARTNETYVQLAGNKQ